MVIEANYFTCVSMGEVFWKLHIEASCWNAEISFMYATKLRLVYKNNSACTHVYPSVL
jgi:hypothetical protein